MSFIFEQLGLRVHLVLYHQQRSYRDFMCYYKIRLVKICEADTVFVKSLVRDNIKVYETLKTVFQRSQIVLGIF